jgi:hypothetical protein
MTNEIISGEGLRIGGDPFRVSITIELVSLEESLRHDRVAIVAVKYGALTLNLNVCVTRDRKAIFIEMPMVPRGTKKYHLAKWDSKDVSDSFQRAVIAQIHEKYPEILKYRDLNTFKNALIKQQTEAEEKITKEIDKPKARNQSKFTKVK